MGTVCLISRPQAFEKKKEGEKGDESTNSSIFFNAARGKGRGKSLLIVVQNKEKSASEPSGLLFIPLMGGYSEGKKKKKGGDVPGG